MSDNMTKRAKEYMNADFVYEDYKLNRIWKHIRSLLNDNFE